MKEIKLLLPTFFIFIFFVSSFAQGQERIQTSEQIDHQDITAFITLARGPVGTLEPSSLSFEKLPDNTITSGYGDQVLWLRLDLENTSNRVVEKILYLNSPLVGKLSLYKNLNFESYTSSGPGIPLESRDSKNRLGGFNIQLEPQEKATYHIKLLTHHAINAQIYLTNPLQFEKAESQVKAILFFYIGGILSLVIYNFFLGLFTTQKDHLIYALFALSFGLTALTIHGALDTYFFPNSSIVFTNYLLFFSSSALLSSSLFVKRFLNIGTELVLISRGLYIITASSLVCMLASFFLPSIPTLNYIGYLIDISIAVGILFFIYCGIFTLLKRQFILSYYFLISWIVIFIGTATWFLSNYGFIVSNALTKYSLLFANLGEMLILSLGLAYKIRVLDREKRAALVAAEDKDRYHRLVRVLAHDVANAVSSLQLHIEQLTHLCRQENLLSSISSMSKVSGRLEKILKGARQEEVFNSYKARAHMDQVELKSACDEAISHFAWEAGEKGVQVYNNVAANIYVNLDRSAFVNQVLSNLLSNAIKFTDSGRNIFFEVEVTDLDTILIIRDEGIGIHPDFIQDIFKGKKFFSERGTANEVGSGLGTTLITEYMKLFNGRIEVSSTHISQSEKSGTSIRLIFPRKINS